MRNLAATIGQEKRLLRKAEAIGLNNQQCWSGSWAVLFERKNRNRTKYWRSRLGSIFAKLCRLQRLKNQ